MKGDAHRVVLARVDQVEAGDCVFVNNRWCVVEDVVLEGPNRDRPCLFVEHYGGLPESELPPVIMVSPL